MLTFALEIVHINITQLCDNAEVLNRETQTSLRLLLFLREK